MRLLLLCFICGAAANGYGEILSLVQVGPPHECVSNTCGPKYTCEVRECRCEACIPKKLTCEDIQCEPNEECYNTPDGPECRPKKLTCEDIQCEPNEKCYNTPDGPECRPKTCADIQCAAGTICDLLPDGPDCVPDVPSCEGHYCRRGTNCYIRKGAPICLPNTCEVRTCGSGLNCIDTVNGALCKKGKVGGTCEGKYCPPNTVCEMTPEGPTCSHI